MMKNETSPSPWPSQHLLCGFQLREIAARHDAEELEQERPANDAEDDGWPAGSLSAHADRAKLLEQLARVMPVYEAAVSLASALPAGGDMLAPTARVDALRTALEGAAGTGDHSHGRDLMEQLAAWLSGQEGRKLEVSIDEMNLHCLVTRPGEEPCPISTGNRSKRTSQRWGDLADHLHTLLGITMCVVGQAPSEVMTDEMEDEIEAARKAPLVRPVAPELAPLFG